MPIVPIAIRLSCALTKATGQFVQLYTIRLLKIKYLWKTIALVEIREQAKA
ncbi:hypothetical protein DSM106972_098920 [Dulcicalothrix desertica PCC 7102]|uniref:Uncharacterized protein n=1 Tax=Dulcicalothrix desertica PCC 7102 TaxID=232991 RepID=A0A433UFB0_9CYAN|nr:hypothetical protein [Dulcicalothrix desertica]RUS92488.1 hypothetical protein DSM106972_098920 [Dulcicalothrix desertica PCC 7102]TWH42571.1 hypothetical protein CAL7102_06239 [Dulcicalothrix desertica PCC 7102]